MTEKQDPIEPMLDRTGPEKEVELQLIEAKQRELDAELAAELQEMRELSKTAAAR